jgi:hypothetical protein
MYVTPIVTRFSIFIFKTAKGMMLIYFKKKSLNHEGNIGSRGGHLLFSPTSYLCQIALYLLVKQIFLNRKSYFTIKLRCFTIE